MRHVPWAENTIAIRCQRPPLQKFSLRGLTCDAGAGYMGAMFLWIGAAMLFFVNLIIVAMLRTTCRNEGSSGRVGRLGRLVAWWKPEYLLIPMRMVLFLCSLIYSSTIFLGWQASAHMPAQRTWLACLQC